MNIIENTPLESIKQMFSYLTSKYTHEFKFKSGFFTENSCQEESGYNATFGKKVKMHIARLTQPFIECLREAQEAGEINPSIDIDKLAESIWNGFENALIRVKVSKSTEPLDAFQYKAFEVMIRK